MSIGGGAAGQIEKAGEEKRRRGEERRKESPADKEEGEENIVPNKFLMKHLCSSDLLTILP